ncbi:MAG: radical SAM protein [Candidatus Omnitrophica bacterium]|nr:radical SAM protein [Candidatus Omnitrophota bacterium]
MKIKLINLPQPNSLDDKLDPPLGLMYIKSFLKKHNIDSDIVDLPFVDRDDWKDKIGDADLYGMTVYSASLYLAKEVAKIAKENNPKAKIIVGGPHPTTLQEQTLEDEPNFDIVVMQEGEKTMLEIAEGRSLSAIDGIVYRHSRQIYKNTNRGLISDLDIIPFPDRELLAQNKYTRKVLGNFATSLITSRGCVFNCSFCCKDVFGSKVRFRSINSVIEEVKQVIERFGIRHFLFYDDTFVLKRDRLYSLCEKLSKLDIIFRCNGNARHNTFEDYQMLYEAGCREIAFGIETGSQRILNIINKGVTVEQNRKAIIDARRAGLLVKAYLMIGNPGETKESVQETIKFVKETDPDQFTLFTFVPLPGSDIWKNPEKYKIKIINRDFKEYFNIAGDNEGGAVIETEELGSDDIRKLREELLGFLKLKGQRGRLQDYYTKL